VERLRKQLALSYVMPANLATLLPLLECEGGVDALFDKARFSSLFYRHLKHISSSTMPDWRRVDKELLWSSKSNHFLIPFDDSDYPERLKHIPHPPFLLRVVGDRLALKVPHLAIVGSRKATQQGLQLAKVYAKGVVESGLGVVSGLARGIDAAAHEGALCGNGVTIAVLAHGLHRLYPKEHLSLARTILDNEGAIVSEYPLYQDPTKRAFVARNRIISGLSLGVFVVEASIKSGSLSTARYALDQGREVFALPGTIHSPLTKGCHVLIREGAVLVENVEHILSEISLREDLLINT
jgi:DNA processing protein